MTSPIFPNSNMFSPRSPSVGFAAASSSAMPWTTRFVDVPISVQSPPRMVANDSGMSSFVAGIPTRSAQRFTMGAKMTTTGVLLRKAEMNDTIGIMLNNALRSPQRLAGSRR